MALSQQSCATQFFDLSASLSVRYVSSQFGLKLINLLESPKRPNRVTRLLSILSSELLNTILSTTENFEPGWAEFDVHPRTYKDEIITFGGPFEAVMPLEVVLLGEISWLTINKVERRKCIVMFLIIRRFSWKILKKNVASSSLGLYNHHKQRFAIETG